MSLSPLFTPDFSNPTRKAAAYNDLARQADALFAGERDWIANLAQFAALIYTQLPDLNWAGFYLAQGSTLVLGPFQGKVACVRIPFDRGVCGACASSRTPQIVPDVHAFAGHIACDAASASELVLPVTVAGRLRAVFDLDSPTLARFDQIDAQAIGTMLTALVRATDWGRVPDA